MKNILLTLTGVCLILFSCKKEESQQALKPSVTAKKYVVKFNVSDFEQSVGEISANGVKKNPSVSAAVPLDSCINNLVFLAYDSTGKEVGRIRQVLNSQYIDFSHTYIASHNSPIPNWADPYEKPFGTLVDSLPSGKYKIIIAGSNVKQARSLFTINTRHPLDDVEIDVIQFRVPLNFADIAEEIGLSPERISKTEDTFLKGFSLTVGSQDIQQAVTLERITGKLEVNILDQIPANADKIEFKIYDAAIGIKLSTLQVGGSTDYLDEGENSEYPETQMFFPIKLSAADKGQSSYKYIKFLYGRDQPVRVKIQCFDVNGNIIASKNIPNVRIYKNKRTILSGKLFETTPQTGFAVSVNSSWDPATVEVPF